MSKLINKTACENCRLSGADASGDNLAVYDDGHTYCFACFNYTAGNKQTGNEKEFVGTLKAIPKRGLSLETCKKLDIITGYYKKLDNCIGFQYSHGFKIRTQDKQFIWCDAEMDKMELFALNKCDISKPLILTEGEFDTAACWEIGYQAASILSGSSVYKDLHRNKNKLEQFSEIWLAFDNDDVGNKATEIAINVLNNVRIYLIDFKEFKDANEALLADKLTNILESRIEHRPKGIIFGSELNFESLWTTPKKGITLPWKGINESLCGLEYGQIYTVLAGTSIGKSSFLRELIYYYRINFPDLKIANIFLEESQNISPIAYIALHKQIPIGKLKRNRELVSEKEQKDLTNSLLNTDKLMFINEDFDKSSTHLINTIKYLVKYHKFDIIVLDHISYIIGRSAVSKNGERRDIDELLYTLQDTVRSLNCILIAACHLTDPPNEPGWEDGRVPKLYSGRGSRVLAQVPDGVIALSRNMNNSALVNCMKVHVLKNRWDGKLGHTDTLIHLENTGRFIAND